MNSEKKKSSRRRVALREAGHMVATETRWSEPVIVLTKCEMCGMPEAKLLARKYAQEFLDAARERYLTGARLTRSANTLSKGGVK